MIKEMEKINVVPLPDVVLEEILVMQSTKKTWNQRSRAATILGMWVIEMEKQLSEFDKEFSSMRDEFLRSVETLTGGT